MSQGTMTFREHLVELRSRLMKSVAAILLGSIVGLVFNAWAHIVTPSAATSAWHSSVRPKRSGS